MKFPHLPVLGFRGATQNFEALQSRLTAIEQSYGSAYRSAVQKIPNNAFTLVKLDTAIHNENGCFDLTTGWYTTPTDGIYQIIGWTGMSFPGLVEVDTITAIVVGTEANEAARGYRFPAKVVGAGLINGTASCIRKCAKGDKIGLSVYQASGAERETEAFAARQNRLDVMRLV